MPSSADRRHHNLKYGYRHRQLRDRWAAAISHGGVTCSRCAWPIRPTDHWDLGHHDGSLEHSGVEHRQCNRGTAGNGAANTNARRAPDDTRNHGYTSRDW